MTYILNIETATKNCSVSLSKDGVILSLKEIAEEQFSHAEKLHSFILMIMNDAGVEFSDLNAVAVSKGPGSYTGLRIGVSAAKGYCYALNIPLIAIDSLEILANQLAVKEGLIIPMLDARRMEVYMSVFDKDYKLVETTKAEVISETSLEQYTGLLHLVGDGALKCQELITRENIVYYPDVKYPSARELGILALDKFIKKQFEDVAYFEPFYLKDFVLNR